MTTPLTLWLDFTSPYAYFALDAVERLACSHGRELVWLGACPERGNQRKFRCIETNGGRRDSVAPPRATSLEITAAARQQQ